MPAAIINQSAADGVIISLSVVGKLKASGDQTYVEKWLPAIREHKMSTIALLSDAGNNSGEYPTNSDDDRNILSQPNQAYGDDRRLCMQCQNLRGRVCKIAAPGKLVSAREGYQPMRDVLHRCSGYVPNLSDTDQRVGTERWLGLNMRGSE